MGAEALPVGKLPLELLARLLARAPVTDPRVRLGPGVGLDCAVLDLGERLLVLKSDPITFATGEIGWYLVQVNANDLATTGATPRWLLLTMLLPDGQTRPADVEAWAEQVFAACREQGISVIGGHTEVTYGLARPVLVGTLIGEVERGRLVTPAGAQPGDRLLLTKGVPIEGTALLAREFASRLAAVLSPAEVAQAQAYLIEPGLSVVADARIASAAGRVTAMHDPTEGGLAGALWELAEACGHSLCVALERVPVPPLAARVCGALGLNPLATIASGALLLTAPPAEDAAIERALLASGIPCATIGWVEAGPAAVWQAEAGRRGAAYPRPARDEVARLYSETAR
ncbi:MAG: AIR synthase family protein [Anaerolineales bacterium]|nr:AIR synthase family protein [Anaerolineales bacterium]